ncbi:hypothetical protein PCYB_002330 [Plasmodium cynomolgi strain B]|uniref:KIR-like CYIR protein n=1 Tax=Plasmodium cynomolgi (strain B) TaxID=1120755 RepID=K6UZS7_PLACD|nr:hypothetical protein PCYB_002330 [Plasmodium cynomolgi strain B]GAB69484.1 hypothetical protein PCYB_002330 [Plasmodium cynomolgi strain B]
MAPGVQGQKVDKLPSQEIYDKFENAENCAHLGRGKSKAEIVGNVKLVLGLYQIKEEKVATEIFNAWCHACSEGGDQDSQNNACHFLFYWIGDRIKDKLNVIELYDVMKVIYHNLPLGQCNNNCRNIYDDISGAFFKWAKDLWDYEYNFSTLKGQRDCSGYTSNPKYTEQLTASQEAYKELCDRCDDSVDSYCMKIKREHIDTKKCRTWKPTGLNCKIIQESVVP